MTVGSVARKEDTMNISIRDTTAQKDAIAYIKCLVESNPNLEIKDCESRVKEFLEFMNYDYKNLGETDA
jgi:hypothetical protein